MKILPQENGIFKLQNLGALIIAENVQYRPKFHQNQSNIEFYGQLPLSQCFRNKHQSMQTCDIESWNQ